MKTLHRLIAALMSVSLLTGLMAGTAAATEPTSTYLALGDSISTGYGLSETDPGFTEQVAEHYAGYTFAAEAVNGSTTADLYTRMEAGELDSAIDSAKLITLTCGGNDMMGSLYERVTSAYNEENPTATIDIEDVKRAMTGEDPTLQRKLITPTLQAIRGFSTSDEFQSSLASFTQALEQVMTYIRSRNPDAVVIMATQYNPYEDLNRGMFQGAYREVESGVTILNEVIEGKSESLGYLIADVYTAFSGQGVELCNSNYNDMNFDFHPNAAGHDLIAKVFLESLPQGLAPVTEDAVSLKSGKITVNLAGDNTGSTLVVAFYNDEGRMVGRALHLLEEGELSVELSAKLRQTAAKVQVFLLNETGLLPVCESVGL